MKESVQDRKIITGKNIIKFAAPVGLLLTSSCKVVDSLISQPEQLKTQQAQISDLQSTVESMSQQEQGQATPMTTQTPGALANETINQTSQEVKNLPEFAISGVPESVKSSDIIHWTANETEEGQKAKGDVIHKNTIGLNTEGFLAEPGVRTVNTAAEEDASAWLITPDTQKKLTSTSPEVWPVNEDGFAMLTAAQAQLQFGDVIVQLGRTENTGLLILVRGLPRHNEQNTDANVPMTISNFDAGFATASMLPPGQYVSEDYVLQNIDAIHDTYGNKNTPSGLGVDGARYAKVFCLDLATGAFTLTRHDSQTGKWELIQTNIK